MSVTIATLPAHPGFGENTSFIFVGFLFVIMVLGILALLTIAIGMLLKQFNQAKDTAPKEATSASSSPSPNSESATPAPSEDDDIPAHVLALIAAATHVILEGRPQRIVGVRRVGNVGWAQEGRREIFSSHRIR